MHKVHVQISVFPSAVCFLSQLVYFRAKQCTLVGAAVREHTRDSFKMTTKLTMDEISLLGYEEGKMAKTMR